MIMYAAQVTPYVWLMPNIQHPIDVLLRQPNFAGQMHRKTNNLVGKWDLKGQARDLVGGATGRFAGSRWRMMADGR